MMMMLVISYVNLALSVCDDVIVLFQSHSTYSKCLVFFIFSKYLWLELYFNDLNSTADELLQDFKMSLQPSQMCIIPKVHSLRARLLAAVVPVMGQVEKCRQQSRKWQRRNVVRPPSLQVVLDVTQYLLGAGGAESGGGGHDVRGFDELWPLLLSMGPILKMDSSMQHDDDSGPQRVYWLPIRQS